MRMLWPWLTLAGLGMYHGVNPAMGWLSAAALSLRRRRRSVVVQSLVPIAIGHLLSTAAAVEMVLVLGVIIDRRPLLMVAGGGLILWAPYHLAYGSRHLRFIGMQAGLAGLVVWSFLMASAHGASRRRGGEALVQFAGVPKILPIRLASSTGRAFIVEGIS
jgi:hypothetical protein